MYFGEYNSYTPNSWVLRHPSPFSCTGPRATQPPFDPDVTLQFIWNNSRRHEWGAEKPAPNNKISIKNEFSSSAAPNWRCIVFQRPRQRAPFPFTSRRWTQRKFGRNLQLRLHQHFTEDEARFGIFLHYTGSFWQVPMFYRLILVSPCVIQTFSGISLRFTSSFWHFPAFFLHSQAHYGLEQPQIETQVLGHSLMGLLGLLCLCALLRTFGMQYTSNITPPDPARWPLQFRRSADQELLRCVGRCNHNIRRHCLKRKKSEKLKFNASWSLFKRGPLILRFIQFMFGALIQQSGRADLFQTHTLRGAGVVQQSCMSQMLTLYVFESQYKLWKLVNWRFWT